MMKKLTKIMTMVMCSACLTLTSPNVIAQSTDNTSTTTTTAGDNDADDSDGGKWGLAGLLGLLGLLGLKRRDDNDNRKTTANR
jgi:MYXO-CTERM domain-containing protein